MHNQSSSDVWTTTCGLRANNDIGVYSVFYPYSHRVDEQYIIKVANFGLTENLYSKCYFREGREVMLPVKWMAIESLRDYIFTEKTDVVSFGEYITEK